MRRPRYGLRSAYLAIVVLAASWAGVVVHGQLAFDAFEVDHPAIGYHRNAPTDAVTRLNQQLETGEQQLRFDGSSGYLKSLLAALAIPVESQMVVYSQTSLQRARISPRNPRVIFFNDSTAVGPRDRMGRSLRDLDLQERLLRYPFGYMIYSDAFDALPAAAKTAIYRRVWEVLSGEERSQKYSRLSREGRRTILEILRDTKTGLPDYFLQG